VLVAALGRAAAHAETPASHAASLASVPPAFALQRPAEAPARPVEPHVHATWLWAAAQLVPSPQWTILDGGGVWAGARWQVTPFLWSLRMRRGLSPFRFFVVEPNVRSWGSFEVFLAPEVSAAPGPFERKLLGRAGARVYAPLAHAGEYLSMSIGGSAFVTSERAGGAIEVGLYTFAGMAGAQVTHAPDPRARSTTVTLALRYF
jgi:hypothetical protein